MTEEEIVALKAAKEEAERKVAEAAELARLAKEEADKAKNDLNTVVTELKDIRVKKSEAEEKLKNFSNSNPNTTDVASLIEQALAKKEADKIEAELKQAIEEFKASKSEFQTDAAGLVFGKFQETLKRFNLSDVRSKADAKARLEEVYKFMNLSTSSGEGQGHEGSPSHSYPAPISTDQIAKTNEELSKISGLPTDKVTSLRNKYPDALSGLGI